MDSSTLVIVCAIVTAGYFGISWSLGAPSLPLPPGPPRKFISGNVHQIPQRNPWLTYAKWAETYGPIMSLNIFGRKMIILNTAQAALDVLESRAAIYSDRPDAWMLKELVKRKYSVFSISHQNPHHKTYRKLLHSALSPRATRDYKSLQEQERLSLLKGLLDTPDNYEAHMRRNAGAVILKVAYGWTVTDIGDYFVTLMEEAARLQAYLTWPGRWLVETFPILRFIPAWFPGAFFKREAQRCRERFELIERVPFNWAKDQIASGNYTESFTSRNLQREDDAPLSPDEEKTLRWCADALYAGGADTTASAMCTLLLAMALNPDIQQRTQAEIDRVVGRSRLPGFEDEDSLAYTNALLKELLRWAPVAPLGLPHRVTQDDEYKGYGIPKGATVFANIWAITHDSSLYPNPESFDPTRFIGDQPQMDSRKLVFGYGRRVCPGAHFAERSLFLNITGILATFNIALGPCMKSTAQDPSMLPFITATTTRPEGFAYEITPRFPEALDLLGVASETR